jgi:UDP-GlcNAc3NAcA epimerase
MRILTVVGNRPQFVKAAAVSGRLREAHEEILLHTGQHHDDNLSDVFFAELGLAQPERQLGIAGGSNTSQTARMLIALEPIIAELSPDAALVYGDTNSTFAGALAAAQAKVPVVHVEAGMRCFDRSMPEEVNRVLTDHLSDLLLCSSQTAAENLAAESADGEVEVVGDVMVDVALRWQPRARADTTALARHGLGPGGYLLLSAHRAGNVDVAERLQALVGLIEALPLPVLFPLHPRTRRRLREGGLYERLAAAPHVTLTEPLGYAEFAALLCQARAVLTDSGGVQKEAYLAGVPCVTLRASTEWVETVQAGWNTLVDLDADAALATLDSPPPPERPPLYGDGRAAERCVKAIESWGGSSPAGREGRPSRSAQRTFAMDAAASSGASARSTRSAASSTVSSPERTTRSGAEGRS